MSKERILIVDDEKAVINLFQQAFSRAGYEVSSAQTGEAAMTLLREKTVHVIFLDLKLPDTNGIDLCREIKKIMPMSIVFAVTGYASLFELADCREAGFDDYFKKPVNIKTLVKTAEDAFEKVNRWKKN